MLASNEDDYINLGCKDGRLHDNTEERFDRRGWSPTKDTPPRKDQEIEYRRNVYNLKEEPAKDDIRRRGFDSPIT